MSKASVRERRLREGETEQRTADESEAWRPGPFAWGVVIVALAILAGVAGYLVGDRDPKPTTVDVGFLQDMLDHHDQAIVMAKTLQTAKGTPDVAHFANEIVATQMFENGQMLAWLEGWGLSYGDPDRKAMTWMGPGFPVSGMPGMAPEADVQHLNEIEGRPADELFIRLMIAHHRGGIGMADFAQRHGKDARVKDLASRISQYQAVEIRELEAVRTRLGLQP